MNLYCKPHTFINANQSVNIAGCGKSLVIKYGISATNQYPVSISYISSMQFWFSDEKCRYSCMRNWYSCVQDWYSCMRNPNSCVQDWYSCMQNSYSGVQNWYSGVQDRHSCVQNRYSKAKNRHFKAQYVVT